jgi:hypothetical protein
MSDQTKVTDNQPMEKRAALATAKPIGFDKAFATADEIASHIKLKQRFVPKEQPIARPSAKRATKKQSAVGSCFNIAVGDDGVKNMSEEQVMTDVAKTLDFKTIEDVI